MESIQPAHSLDAEAPAQLRRSTGDMRRYQARRARPVNRRYSLDSGAIARDSGIVLGHNYDLTSTPGAGTSRMPYETQRVWLGGPMTLEDPGPYRYRHSHQALPAPPTLPAPGPEPQLPALLRLPPINDRREPPRAARRPPVPTGRVRRVLAFLGYGNGNRYRKELVSLISTLSFAFVQFSVTLALIIYSSLHRSPVDHSISEWKACDKPLGAWAVIWIIKLLYDCGMTYWGWSREWEGRQNEQRSRTEDAERAQARPNRTLPTDEEISVWQELGMGSLAIPLDGEEETNDTNSDRRNRRVLPHSKLYSRLSLLLSLIVVAWFLTSNILLYTSLGTCRRTAPHLWWLVFGILCIQYLIILQIFIIAILVFIVGPIIYLFWNLLLMCLGRHPLQNPHYINPEVGKLPKHVVDKIPLVMYIPSPPEGEKSADNKDVITKPTPIYAPGESEHTYPPKEDKSAPPKRRFIFISRKSSKSVTGLDGKQPAEGTKDGEKGGERAAETWEDCWERNVYPFVRLEENRASCAICLLDFEEPKRRVASEVIKSWSQPKQKEKETEVSVVSKDSDAQRVAGANENEESATSNNAEGTEGSGSTSSPAAAGGEVQEVPVTQTQSPTHGQNGQPLRLEDAGEGAQPLRLLECGHVFHKTCIDPWLLDVSGRCPTCQRPVTIPQAPHRKRSR